MAARGSLFGNLLLGLVSSFLQGVLMVNEVGLGTQVQGLLRQRECAVALWIDCSTAPFVSNQIRRPGCIFPDYGLRNLIINATRWG